MALRRWRHTSPQGHELDGGPFPNPDAVPGSDCTGKSRRAQTSLTTELPVALSSHRPRFAPRALLASPRWVCERPYAGGTGVAGWPFFAKPGDPVVEREDGV